MTMLTKQSTDRGITSEARVSSAIQRVEMFGHVTLIEGYALPAFTGCHALVALRDSPGTTVAVVTKAPRLQSLLDTALATGNLIAFFGEKLVNPPTPTGGSWSVDVYGIDGVILYNIH